tara:strand:- start:120 stop:614 length:495 start_codon:yes stop_codon:yes gene_type:complete
MAVIENIEDFKKIKLFMVKAEHWFLSDGFGNSIDNGNYLNLIIQPIDFSQSEFNDCLLEFSEDDIIGKTNEEFLDWMKEQAENEGYMIESLLQSDFNAYPDEYLVDKLFNEKTKELVSDIDTAKLLGNELFQVEYDELEVDQPYYCSLESAKKFLNQTYPFYKA